MDSWRVVLLLAVSFLGCHPEEALSPQQLAARTRDATARCKAGEASACLVACKGNGPNTTCQQGCQAGNGEACLQLATRLERGVDPVDPESPPRKFPEDDDGATVTYERACSLGLAQGCRVAASRILNGQVQRRRDPSAVTRLLKRGCNEMEDPDSCCMMAQLNFRLARSRGVDVGIDFREEGRKWARIAGAYGGKCPLPSEVNR